MKRIVTIYSPEKGTAVVTVDKNSPYECVEEVRALWQDNLSQKDNLYNSISLAEILPIHNLSGIRDFTQISRMHEKIKSGEEILGDGGVPNVKLVLASNGKLLLFDGTHSALAYLQSGRKKLAEIPFLVISGENGQPVTSQEISEFFSEQVREKVKQDWFAYAVNWQAPKGQQLEKREVNTLGELLTQFGEADKSAVE